MNAQSDLPDFLTRPFTDWPHHPVQVSTLTLVRFALAGVPTQPTTPARDGGTAPAWALLLSYGITFTLAAQRADRSVRTSDWYFAGVVLAVVIQERGWTDGAREALGHVLLLASDSEDAP